MDNLIILILGLGLGGVVTYYFFKGSNKNVVRQEAQILLESTKRICKLATVEGEFSEIFQHSNKTSYFFDLFKSEKKALVIVKARALIGFDLAKMVLDANESKKQLLIKDFPQPEIISLDADCQYYDVTNGTFNKFSPQDLTQIQQEAKKLIRQKIEEGHLPKLALDQASEALSLVQHTAKKLGWDVVSTTTFMPLAQKLLNKIPEKI
jgi:hypothetical protein